MTKNKDRPKHLFPRSKTSSRTALKRSKGLEVTRKTQKGMDQFTDRADLEKNHPELMKALDKLAKHKGTEEKKQ